MSIDQPPSGLNGSLAAAIERFSAGGYEVGQVVDARCPCGSEVFRVAINDDVGVAVRVCAGCEDEYGMLDSEDHFDDVDVLTLARCRCGRDEFVVAVGFAFANDDEIRWVSVGLACVEDGNEGVYIDWKIDYTPSRHLLNAV